MLSTLSNWFSKSNISDEYHVWLSWQKNQPISHYSNCYIIDYYLDQRPLARYPVNPSNVNIYYKYCFGKFAPFIADQKNDINFSSYCSLLLDIYDVCKGTTRRITGDPAGIKVLREVISRNRLTPLYSHNFEQYNFNCSLIHAHTVCQYSLSTLIMRLISNYLSSIPLNNDKKYAMISISDCKKAFDSCNFGKTFEPKNVICQTNTKNNAINISKSTPLNYRDDNSDIDNDIKCASWPRNHHLCLRCKNCKRVTENLWGKFDSCIDCHMKRICSICSIKAVVVHENGLPKCSRHQDDSDSDSESVLNL